MAFETPALRDVICTVVGARPNFMKAAPVHAAFARVSIPHAIVHTGQHYDATMSKVFFQDLDLPRPVANLGVGSGTREQQTTAIMLGLERLFLGNPPKAVLVVGDVNSTMAAAIVCAKLGIYCAHVEAGLRSGDWTMPEEINRVLTDSVVDLRLTPSSDADGNLAAEGCPKSSIERVGNVMVDTLLAHLPRARALRTAARFGLPPGGYAVLTLHRPSNVDTPETLSRILGAVREIANRLPVVFPVHPRTRKQIQAAGLDADMDSCDRLIVSEPLGYLEFLSLTSGARMVLTDSGGLQEETTALGIPCLTLRENTERPITIVEGTNVLVGSDPARILAAASDVWEGGARGRVPELWDGHSAERIVAAVSARLS